jgi:acid phosphatase
MTSNCQASSRGLYAVRHNPWVYFVDERSACNQNDVPLTRLAEDITSGALPNVGMLVPNLCNDAHNCSLATADAFLKVWLPRLMSGSDYTSGKLTIVVTFDEGVGASQTIGTAVINPTVHRETVTAALTHAGLSRWLYQLSGSKPQNRAAAAQNFGAAFGL